MVVEGKYLSKMGVSKNNGTPKSSILIGFSIINYPFWEPTPIFGNTQIFPSKQLLHTTTSVTHEA